MKTNLVYVFHLMGMPNQHAFVFVFTTFTYTIYYLYFFTKSRHFFNCRKPVNVVRKQKNGEKE